MKLLRYGSEGFEVRLAQRVLQAEGLLDREPTGKYDAATEFAVRMYQKKHGLLDDGIVGPITRGRMFPGEANRESQDRAIASPYHEKVIEIGFRYKHVREKKGDNRHPDIDRWLLDLGIPVGNPWCLAFLQGIFKEAAQYFGVPDPLKPDVAGCLALWRLVPDQFKITDKTAGRRGDIAVMRHSKSTGHVYLVLGYKGGIYESIEGNTNADGSREGDRWAHKFTRSYSDPKLLGFVRVPNPVKS